MPWAPAILDFLVDWTIGTIILAAGLAAVGVLAGSFLLATVWRRWKERRRARRAGARAAAGASSPAGPKAPTGVGFAPRAALHKLPRPGLRGKGRQGKE